MAAWLEDYLRRFAGGMILITHDRYFLDRVVNRIAELENGRLHSYETNYAGYLEYKAERMEMESASERKRQLVCAANISGLCGAHVPAEPKAETALRAMRRCARRRRLHKPRIFGFLPCLSAWGARRLNWNTFCKVYGSQTVIADFSYHLTQDDRIGVVGVNGTGKSTLLNLIAGADSAGQRYRLSGADHTHRHVFARGT